MNEGGEWRVEAEEGSKQNMWVVLENGASFPTKTFDIIYVLVEESTQVTVLEEHHRTDVVLITHGILFIMFMNNFWKLPEYCLILYNNWKRGYDYGYKLTNVVCVFIFLTSCDIILLGGKTKKPYLKGKSGIKLTKFFQQKKKCAFL